MPLNVRRLFASIFLVVFSFIIASAQTAPTSGEVMRGRISKAKAYIAVKNYNAAIYELENIRRETGDQAVHSVLNVLLVNCFLEQGDYKRAQDFLTTLFNDIKNGKPNAASNYYAAAGQVIKSARNQADRYKALGLSVTDRNLPPEAATDLENMRATLEKVVDQSKTLGKDPKQTSDAMALLEGTTTARSVLARDDYDAQRWKDEVADSREMLANSRSTILNAVNEPVTDATNTVATNTVASNTTSSFPTNTLPVPTNTLPTPTNTASNQPKNNDSTPVFQPVRESRPNADLTAKNDKTEKKTVTEPVRKEDVKKADDNPNNFSTETASNTNQPKRDRRVVNSQENKENSAPSTETTAKVENFNPDQPMSVGSLLEYAVEKPSPVYPPTARTMRQSGVVRVEIVVDEQGKVTTVQNLSGPSLLQSAAKDAVKRWKFKPFTRDGQPVKATGFLNFSFSL
ncbi:MAG: TonB family protein [Acidobacteria bacterium]|nr:TonB family protein [Acidobacteriota bacterium]